MLFIYSLNLWNIWKQKFSSHSTVKDCYFNHTGRWIIIKTDNKEVYLDETQHAQIGKEKKTILSYGLLDQELE